MKLYSSMIAALCVCAVGLPTAIAGVIVNDDFEGYTSQTDFEATWVPIGTTAPISADWSTAQASSPTHSIEIDGTSSNSQQRNQRIFAETGAVHPNTRIIWSFDFYDTNSAAAPYRQYANLQDSTTPGEINQIISLGLSNNQSVSNSGGNYYMARILGHSQTTVDPDGGPNESVIGGGAFFKLNDFGAGLRSTGWHNLRVEISTNDGLSTDYEFYVDGLLAELVSNVGTAATIRSYDNIRVGSGFSNAGNGAYYDNMFVAAVPEPASFTIAGLGLLGIVAVCRRRNG